VPDKQALTAPCGLACFACDLYVDNLTDPLAEMIHQKMGVAKEEIPCRGCRAQDGKHYHLGAGGCATLDCSKAHGVNLCSDCADFPCARLAPLAAGAQTYPHNMKVYNLCRIKFAGIDPWIQEVPEIVKKYYTGKFVVGRGQS
jgi:hypothetical protein